MESGGIAPRILNLGARWRWVVSFTHRPLYPRGKNPRYPLDRTLGGPQSRSGRGGSRRESKPNRPDRPAHSIVTILIQLFPLLRMSKWS